MELYSDKYYIERIRAGELSCYACLVDRYGRKIHSLISQMVRTREDAEELSQDVFMKAFRHLDSFKGESSFSTWLYRIAYNTAISETRKKKREYLAIEEAQIENVSEEQIAAAMGISDEQEQIRRLELAMEQLPPNDKALILLFYMEDKSVEEIAQISGLSQSNVKTRMHRIRKKLYVILNEMEEIDV
ncbi:MAG: sigma-70 family RNA polymerase sigma factor [Tannerellaceae bacterium]|jgi:RNA polymerase sigma-70 factor (ECF subfamily)|nr:sigma-70 family RNA polymerase sigma factor [Tannerellaceae bacterium]